MANLRVQDFSERAVARASRTGFAAAGGPDAAARRAPLGGAVVWGLWHTCPDRRGSWHTHPTGCPRPFGACGTHALIGGAGGTQAPDIARPGRGHTSSAGETGP